MNFLQWFQENGSINQSMPELEKDEVPKGNMIVSEPNSELGKKSILNKKFYIKPKEHSDLKTKEKIIRHPGMWLIQDTSNSFLKAKNFIDGYETVFPIDCIELV